MYNVVYCKASDIPENYHKPANNPNISIWHKLITKFLLTGTECARITSEEVTSTTAFMSVKRYLKAHDYLPIKAIRRGDAVYIYRQDLVGELTWEK